MCVGHANLPIRVIYVYMCVRTYSVYVRAPTPITFQYRLRRVWFIIDGARGSCCPIRRWNAPPPSKSRDRVVSIALYTVNIYTAHTHNRNCNSTQVGYKTSRSRTYVRACTSYGSDEADDNRVRFILFLPRSVCRSRYKIRYLRYRECVGVRGLRVEYD